MELNSISLHVLRQPLERGFRVWRNLYHLRASRNRSGGPMPNPIYAHVGTRLRLKRSTLGLSQRQLSERLGCDEARVAAMEDGRIRIGVAELFEIATVLRVPLAWSYGEP